MNRVRAGNDGERNKTKNKKRRVTAEPIPIKGNPSLAITESVVDSPVQRSGRSVLTSGIMIFPPELSMLLHHNVIAE